MFFGLRVAILQSAFVSGVFLPISTGSDIPGHPRSFAAPFTSKKITIDGDIYKPVWNEVPWSEDFGDIQGADAPMNNGPEGEHRGKNTRTRMKMRWDNEYLYIAAEMLAHDWPIYAEFTKRNEPIYQKDSDFEVFLDTDGSNSFYKELELNAKNTVWNLMLNRPYSSAGSEHSGREHKKGDANFWDVSGQKTAANMVGTIGKANSEGMWTCEIALHHNDSLSMTQGKAPAKGKYWRINFSRVERKGKYNWVWSPQMVWNPDKSRYVGEVNMHAPDAWGYVRFVDEKDVAGPTPSWVDPDWNIKAAAHQVFYAEKQAMSPSGGGRLLNNMRLKHKNMVNASLFNDIDIDVVDESSTEWKVLLKDKRGCSAQITFDNQFSIHCPSGLRIVDIMRYTISAILLIGALMILIGLSCAIRPRLWKLARSE